MDFSIIRNLENKVFSTSIKFEAYGGFNLTADEEEALIAEFGAPTIDLGAIEFRGNLLVGPNMRVVIDGINGEVVNFVLTSKKFEVKSGFEVNYVIDSRKVDDREVGTLLNTKELVAEAKCVLFEDKMKEAITAAINELKDKITTFGDGAVGFTA